MVPNGNRCCQHKIPLYQRIDVNTAIAPELFTLPQSSLKPIEPWHWRQLPLAKRSGSHVFEALFLHPRGDSTRENNLVNNCHIATLLESPVTPHNTHLARYSICAGSPRFMENQPQLWTPPVGNILPFLRRLLQVQKPESPVPAELPFTGGWLGWLGYDLAWEIEQLPHLNTDPLPFPIAYWYEPDSFAVLDHHQQILWLATTDSTQLDSLQHQLEEADRETGVKNPAKPDKSNPITPIFHSSEQDYIAA
ncbi:MAG: anthranilate synthase component I, partial [Coleofasciculus sp. C2-GNP5-27]